nr:transmembrane protein CCDC163 [Delphinus delphis]
MIEVLQIVEYKREIRKKCMMAAPKGTLTFRRWNEEDKPIEETEKEGPQKCKATSGLHRELRNEQQLPWEEPEMLREEQKLLQGQLSRHPVLLLKPKTEGRHSGRTRWGSSRGTPFLTRSPAAFSSRPRASSGTTHSLRAPRCS